MAAADHAAVSATLARAGCLASEEEAAELIAAAGDPARLAGFVERRVAGEPTAWIVGRVRFCGLPVRVHPGVYVPRWQTEPLAERAASLLTADGVAVDVCTGSGAIAVVLRERHPGARVLGTDTDPVAVACARDNGVEAYLGDLMDPVPAELAGCVDVVTGVVPYVPTDELRLLPRDVLAFEPLAALDGGRGGTRHLVRAVRAAHGWLRPGGMLLLELGGEQGDEIARLCEGLGFVDIEIVRDDDGEVRAIQACRR